MSYYMLYTTTVYTTKKHQHQQILQLNKLHQW